MYLKWRFTKFVNLHFKYIFRLHSNAKPAIFEECFRKVPLSIHIRVGKRPNRRNQGAFISVELAQTAKLSKKNLLQK